MSIKSSKARNPSNLGSDYMHPQFQDYLEKLGFKVIEIIEKPKKAQ